MADLVSSATVPPQLTKGFVFFRKEEEKRFFVDHLDKSTRLKQRFIPDWQELEENALVIPQRNSYERLSSNNRDLIKLPQYRTRSRLKDPESHQALQNIVAQALGLIMGGREYVAASPVGDNDYEKKRAVSRLLQAFLEMPGTFITEFLSTHDAFLFGTSITELTWLTRARMQMVKGPIFDEEGNFLGQGFSPQEIIHFDGPLFKQISIYDFNPDPGGTSINGDMDFVSKCGRITKQKVLELIKVGVYEKEPAMRALEKAEYNKKAQAEGLYQRFPNIPSDVPDEYGLMTFYEGVGEVPYNPPDGYRNRVLTMLNGEIVRSHINPMIDGNKWFLAKKVNPISDRFYGMSPIEAVRYLQDALDQLLMMYSDVSAMAARGPLLMGNSFGGDPSRLRRRIPLDIIPCADPDAVKAYPIDLNALQFSSQEMLRQKLNIRQATGAINPQDVVSGDRETATAVSEMVRMASQRVDMMVQVIERDYYPQLGRMFFSRIKQFAPPDGVEAYFRGERIEVSLEDIEDVDVSFNGSRQTMSHFQRSASMREAINLLSLNPNFVMQYPDIATVYLRDILHLPNAEAITERAQAEAQTTMLLQAAMQGQQAGGGGTVGPASMGTESGLAEQEGVRLA